MTRPTRFLGYCTLQVGDMGTIVLSTVVQGIPALTVLASSKAARIKARLIRCYHSSQERPTG